MVLVISQDTFNSAVKENIEDLGMDPDEAIEEAVKQFEAQGVDLSQIVKEVMAEAAKSDVIDNIVEALGKQVKHKATAATICCNLDALKTECDKGIQYKVFAGKAGAYSLLLHVFQTYNEKEVQILCLKTLISLMTKQPDLFDDKGMDLIITTLRNSEVPFEIKRLLLRWAKECCVLHEKNRQKIFGSKILDDLKEILNEGSNVEFIRDALGLCRGLVLDDDVRVEFGMAHEHARVIASEILCSLMALLSRYRQEEQLTHDIVLTMSTLLVRTEFCKKVEDANGLEVILHVMETFNRNENIIKQSLKLLKALAGNDSVKVTIIQKMGFGMVLKECLDFFKGRPGVAISALGCVAALTLRCPENSKVFFDLGVPNGIVQAMRSNPDNKLLQKTGSWAIRNMVSRSRNQTAKFLDLGVEEILRRNLKQFKDIEYDTKAALRDLGCQVQLKEEWTGKGGALNTSSFKHTQQ